MGDQKPENTQAFGREASNFWKAENPTIISSLAIKEFLAVPWYSTVQQLDACAALFIPPEPQLSPPLFLLGGEAHQFEGLWIPTRLTGHCIGFGLAYGSNNKTRTTLLSLLARLNSHSAWRLSVRLRSAKLCPTVIGQGSLHLLLIQYIYPS